MAAAVIGIVVLAGGALAGMASGWARYDGRYAPRSHAVRDDFARDPLGSRLRRGYASLEIGVWLDDRDRLIVGDRGEPGRGGDSEQLGWLADPGGELDRLILRPLIDRVAANDGRVYVDTLRPFRLLIALRESDPRRQQRAYEIIEALLSASPAVFAGMSDGVLRPGPVTVLLTGQDVPRDHIAAADDRPVFVDGTFADLGPWGTPATLTPLISEPWSGRFDWDGRAEMPADERDALHRLVAAAHAEGRRVRITGLPGGGWRIREAFWSELATAGVDLIGTARPAELATFLRRYGNQPPASTTSTDPQPVRRVAPVPARVPVNRAARPFANAGQARPSSMPTQAAGPARHRTARSTATTRVGTP